MRIPRNLLLAIPFVLILLPATAGAAPSPQDTPARLGLGVGETLTASGSLRDMRGNQRSLSDFQGYRALVLIFAGTQCPTAEHYFPRVIELEARYRPQSVKFLGVYSNENETIDEIAAHAHDHDVPFLLLKDLDQALADELGVSRTPGVIVLGEDLALRYRGRIDDQFSANATKQEASREDLVQALDEVLASEPVSVSETTVDGSPIDRTPVLQLIEGVTFTKDVAPIIQRRCQVCHRPGQIGPFSLMTYQDAVKRKNMVGEVVVQRRMPPWHADDRYGKFANDRSMSDEEIAILKSWIESGTPRGNPKDMPPPVEWLEGEWNIGEPDLVLPSPEEIEVPADGVMDYIYITAPVGIDEDIWVERAEIRPSDASVVHHILVYIRPPGGGRIYEFDGTTSALTAWVPGDEPMKTPVGTAVKIPAGSSLTWELHYTPNGLATKDRSSIGLVLAKKPPETELKFNIFSNRRLRIAPDSPHHKHESTFEFKEDARLVSLMPHMHLRGKSWKYEAIYPDGRREVLLSVPRWDFNWQTQYFFQDPIAMPKGTVIHSVAHWDNSDNNVLNPDSGVEVGYHLQTSGEMMNGWVRYMPDKVDGRK